MREIKQHHLAIANGSQKRKRRRAFVSDCGIATVGACTAQELCAGHQHKGQPALQHALHWEPQRAHQRGRAAGHLPGPAR